MCVCRGVCLCACNHVQTQVCVAGRCWVGRDSQHLHWQLCGWLSGQRVTSNSSSEVSGEKALEHLPEGGHPELSAGLGCGLSAEAPNCWGRKRGGWLQRGSRRAARWLQWAWDPGAEPPSGQSREGRGGEWGWGLPEAHFDLDSEEGSRRSGQEGLQGLCNPVASIIIGLVSKNSPEEGSRTSGQEGLQGLCNPVASIIIGLVSKNSPVELHDKGFLV